MSKKNKTPLSLAKDTRSFNKCCKNNILQKYNICQAKKILGGMYE